MNCGSDAERTLPFIHFQYVHLPVLLVEFMVTGRLGSFVGPAQYPYFKECWVSVPQLSEWMCALEIKTWAFKCWVLVTPLTLLEHIQLFCHLWWMPGRCCEAVLLLDWIAQCGIELQEGVDRCKRCATPSISALTHPCAEMMSSISSAVCLMNECAHGFQICNSSVHLLQAQPQQSPNKPPRQMQLLLSSVVSRPRIEARVLLTPVEAAITEYLGYHAHPGWQHLGF